jgi:hypothetical protein
MELSHERVSRVMPEHRGDGAGPGSDGRYGQDAVHTAHGVRGGGPAIVGRRRGEELFRRGNLSSDSIGGLALALPHEGLFPQMSLSRRVLRTSSGEGGDGVSLVGDRWRRRLINDRRWIDDQRWGNWWGRVLRTGNTRGNRIHHSRKGRGGARSGEEGPTGGAGPCPPHAGPSAGETGTDPHAPATSAYAPAGEAAAAAGRGGEGSGGRAHPRWRRRQDPRGLPPPPGGGNGSSGGGAHARGGGPRPGGEGREGGGGREVSAR